jgi:NADH-quinone oxidoreductase subunit J
VNDAFEVSGIVTVAFWVASAITIGAALMVVTVRDVFKAAVFLVGSFIGVSAIFFLLNAEFVGVVQILVYVGAVSILIAFSVMMIRDVAHGSRPSRGRITSVTVAALVAAAVAVIAYNTDWTKNSELTNPDAIAGLTGQFVEVENEAGNGRVSAVPAGQPAPPEAQPGVLVDSTGTVGTLMVRDFVLPFETVGLVIVAALIGGLAIMRPGSGQADSRGGG